MAEAKTTAQKAAPKTTSSKKSSATQQTAAKKTPATKKPAASKQSAAPRKPASKAWSPSNEERYNMIQVAAYYLAERDGFSGDPVGYWTAAEIQINNMLAKQ